MSLTACEGTYQRNDRCYIYRELPDGTKEVIDCQTSETFHFKAKSWRQIINENLDPPDPQPGPPPTNYDYYYVGELYDGETLIDSWEFRTLGDPEEQLPDILSAAGITPAQGEIEDFMDFITPLWVDPQTDWHVFN